MVCIPTLVCSRHARKCKLCCRSYYAGNSQLIRRSQLQIAASRIAQSVERKTLNLVVVGSSPTLGACFLPI